MTDDDLSQYAEHFCRTSRSGWRLVEPIGSGKSATVYQVANNDLTAALKIYHPRFFQGDNAIVESRRISDQMSLQGHGHPYLIDFYETGQLKDSCYLLMEYFPWSSLEDCLTSIDRNEIAAIISKIASAAEYLETRNFIHRDIKPANILISDDYKEVKLLDLGVIRPISTDDSDGTDQGEAFPFVATAQYSSPAYLFREGAPTERMWKALTFYQLGAVLHDLLMQRPLFAAEARTRNRHRVTAAVLLTTPEVGASDVPPWLIALARNCLVKNDDTRLNRVNWNSFDFERYSDLNEHRRKLGLGTTQSRVATNASVGHSERLRIRINNAFDLLNKLCRHVLRHEGFPPAGFRSKETDLRSRVMLISFVPTNASDATIELHFVLRLSMQIHSQDHVDIYFRSYLTKHEANPLDEDVDTLFWTTSLDDLSVDEDHLISLLTEEFIARYASADDQLRQFERSDDVLLEVEREVA